LALGARPDSTETIPYGVDTIRFAPNAAARSATRSAWRIPPDAPFIFSAGRLVSKKGFEFLIDAAARLAREMPALTVAIAGEGDLRHALDARAASSGARVLMLGTQSQDDVAALCAAADVVAVPSVHDDAGNVDGLPNFALEAMASATPVVATRVGGLPQAIDDGVSGRLVPERDVTQLANVVRELLVQRDLARAIGEAARTRVTRDFGWDRAAARFEAVYLAAGARPR
jgi:glycosyltransferase involved in cell wall biosynthesis